MFLFGFYVIIAKVREAGSSAAAALLIVKLARRSGSLRFARVGRKKLSIKRAGGRRLGGDAGGAFCFFSRRSLRVA